MDDRKWRVLSSDYLFREPWFTVRRERVELPGGAVIPSYYIMEFPDWVNVIAITVDGKFVMVRQYRHALGVTCPELCAGVRDREDPTPEAAARRELLEETGYGGGRWREWMALSPNPTNHTNMVHCFLATDVEKVAEPSPEETEDISVELLSEEEVLALLENGSIVQALMAAPLWKYFASDRSRT